MNHPDIINYLSHFLDSKSLAMISNTNHTNYNICDNIYKNRSIYNHVSSMINIVQIDYRCQLKNKIVLNDHYDHYRKIKMSFYNCAAFRSKRIEIRFFNNSVKIYCRELLTPNIIQEINDTFNIELIDIEIECISTAKTNLNEQRIEESLKKHELWDEQCYSYKCKVTKMTITFYKQTLSMRTFTMDQTFDLCKKLL